MILPVITCNEKINYFILCLKHKTSKLVSWSKIFCLQQGSEMNPFSLEKVQGLKALAEHLKPIFPSVPPPPTPSRGMGAEGEDIEGYTYEYIKLFRERLSERNEPLGAGVGQGGGGV